eukprot:1641695-Pleurochrysis_carterae.AAC.5
MLLTCGVRLELCASLIRSNYFASCVLATDKSSGFASTRYPATADSAEAMYCRSSESSSTSRPAENSCRVQKEKQSSLYSTNFLWDLIPCVRRQAKGVGAKRAMATLAKKRNSDRKSSIEDKASRLNPFCIARRDGSLGSSLISPYLRKESADACQRSNVSEHFPNRLRSESPHLLSS